MKRLHVIVLFAVLSWSQFEVASTTNALREATSASISTSPFSTLPQTADEEERGRGPIKWVRVNARVGKLKMEEVWERIKLWVNYYRKRWRLWREYKANLKKYDFDHENKKAKIKEQLAA